ncbi:hypothetical protein [Chlorobium sp.]
MDWFGLAHELKMPVARAQREISLQEFRHWQAFFKIKNDRLKEARRGK